MDVSRSALREGLKISPISVSIAIGKKDAHSVYQRTDKPFHHRVTVVHVYPDGKVEILDHYASNKTRTLSADYRIGWPAYITLNRIDMMSLIKVENSPKVYYKTRDGKSLRYIPTMQLLIMGVEDGLWKNESSIQTISEQEFSKYKKLHWNINFSLS